MTIRTFVRILMLAALTLAASLPARAGAWTRPKGSGQIIFNYHYYDTVRGFDAQGHRYRFAKNARFTKHEIGPYIEYGFTNRLTFVGQVSAPWLTYRDSTVIASSSGLGDGEVGLKYRLTRTENGLVCSLQASAKLHAYPKDRVPSPGNHQNDYEGRLLIGRSFALGGGGTQRYGYWSIETAYRYRTGFPTDQLRGDFTLGLNLSKRFLGLAEAYVIKGLRVTGGPAAALNPNLHPGFDLYKAQVSGVFRLSSSFRVQAGWIADVWGRVTGAGSTLLLSLWYEF